MNKINLYCYKEEDGSTTVTPVQRNENDVAVRYRLVADDGKILKKNDDLTFVVDVFEEDIKNWEEIDDIHQEETEAESEEYVNSIQSE